MSDANVIAQSPTPPFYRETAGNIMQTLTVAGAASLGVAVTYLATASGGPHAITIPSGTYEGQVKRIQVRGDLVSTTASWTLTGSFITPIAGFKFDTYSTSLILEWDGQKWHNTGGNAEPTF